MSKPMTINDFDRLKILNYALGELDGVPFIQIIRRESEQQLVAFPLLVDKNLIEVEPSLIEELNIRIQNI